MTESPTVLLLGGTTEAAALAAAVAERLAGQVDLVVSFAGRTAAPTAPHGRVRVGGFGGHAGLRSYLAEHRVSAVIDALHPFAAVMPFHAYDACRDAGIPMVKLVRRPWTQSPGDRWTRTGSMGAAPAALAALGAQRVLLTVGRQDLDPFRTVTGVDFTVRSIEPADLYGSWTARPLVARGPFTVEGERQLLQTRSIDVVVSKDSGGAATVSKLVAARELEVAVVMIDRPPVPAGTQVSSVDDAIAWLSNTVGHGSG